MYKEAENYSNLKSSYAFLRHSVSDRLLRNSKKKL